MPVDKVADDVMPLIHPTEKRRAFTLIELMVVIAVLGLMVAFLLPAIQAARESSRATACRNNLKQIGIALIHYESVHKHFPKGVEGRFDLALFRHRCSASPGGHESCRI